MASEPALYIRSRVGPDREQVISDQLCPPHAFDQGWGLRHDDDFHGDTGPVLFCASCGEIREMRVPAA